ncbi:sporulation protein YabP [Sedimentibacter sp. zth1]|uniref:sporulation protein YabP n=1 Tax=Sedimentibacter sp. zth1 TaxID=2816908 RepID=UPI001A928ACB|nr:sporulation protein YabP [Sedimentibacter sp. zth1]QSX05497.1 sporulation protein YabP [Sedimentibacter sp. zth1]
MEDKIIQILSLENRERLNITGVEKVDNFNDEVVILSTNKGKLTIKGINLTINKLNVDEGKITTNGQINSLIYTENNKEKVGLIKKLFR